mgnify:CR=1 FL=1
METTIKLSLSDVLVKNQCSLLELMIVLMDGLKLSTKVLTNVSNSKTLPTRLFKQLVTALMNSYGNSLIMVMELILSTLREETSFSILILLYSPMVIPYGIGMMSTKVTIKDGSSKLGDLIQTSSELLISTPSNV